MSRGFTGRPAENPNNCLDAYAPQFWLGKPGALTLMRMPDAGIRRDGVDNFAVHNLLDGQGVDRSPYLCRTWTFQHQWLTPDVMSVFMEYATRQRGIGPFILIDPQMKNLLTPNQASGTDALHTTEGFVADAQSNLIAVDSFNRVVAAGWGSADTGQAWGVNDTGNTSVNGTLGIQNHSAVGATLIATLGSINIPDGELRFELDSNVALPTGGDITTLHDFRFIDSTNLYRLRLTYKTTNVVEADLVRYLGGVGLTLAGPVNVPGITASTAMKVAIRWDGTSINAKVWARDGGVPEPVAWMFSVTDATLVGSGSIRFISVRDTGNTNNPTQVRFNNMTLANLRALNTLASSTSDSVQGERSLSWTLSPPVSGTASTLHLVPQTGLYGFCIPPGKRVALSGWAKIATGAPDSSVTVGPALVWMNGVGAVQSTVTGATITAVSGSAGTGWRQFCVTGLVPTGSAGVYLDPQIIATNSSITSNTTMLFDQLQLEITDAGCTTWEYGQGQPLVGVRAEGETIPRILRTDLSYIAVEVT